MAPSRSRILTAAATLLAVVTIPVVGAGSARADVCQIHCDNHYSTPTPGVTCNNQIWATLDGGRGYRGICTGSPVGTSRGYKYREAIECVYAGHARWRYAAYQTSGWSTPDNMCPDNAPALASRVEFVFV